MKEIVVSLSKDDLKVCFLNEKGLAGIVRKLENNVANDSDILDLELFSQNLKEMLNEVTYNKPIHFPLNILIEPQDVFMSFVTVKKDSGEIEEQIIAEVSKKLGEHSLDNLYFSYQKIAPFVFQFMAVKKAHIDQLLEITGRLSLNLKCISPWIGLLPKFVDTNSPAIFLVREEEEQLISLSELGGIYFFGEYNEKKSQTDIHKLVNELSVYNRDEPIKHLYLLNYEVPSISKDYEIHTLNFDHLELENTQGYELHLMFREVFTKDNTLYETQLNILNLLPLPTVQNKNKALVYVGATSLALVILAGGVFGFVKYKSMNASKNLALNTQDVPAVLSENNSTPQSTTTTEPVVETPVAPPEEKKELNRSDLVIRVENGTTIGGLAGATRDFLTELGYEVSDVGDALESNRETTLIQYKTDKLEYIDMLVSDMQDKFTVETKPDLAPDLSYDILIIAGAEQSIK